MKKMLLAGLVGMLCFCATGSFAQTAQQMLTDKVVSLEVQNRVLSEKVTRLEKENASLHSQVVQLKKAASAVRPYYANKKVQDKCEKYPVLAAWTASAYAGHSDFKVQGICETSGFFQNNKTRYQLWLQTSRGLYVLTREGRGNDPDSWDEHIFTAHSMPPCSFSH